MMIVSVVLFSLAVIGTSADGSATTHCDTAAYVIDRDPDGLNVRTAPAGAVITRIPAGAMVTITGQSGAWLRISSVTYPSDMHETFARTNKHQMNSGWVKLDKLEGWVFAKNLGTTVRNYHPTKKAFLHAEPNVGSKKTIRFNDVEPQVTVLGCRNDWLYVEHAGRMGWLSPSRNCPNSLTTCPGEYE
ncbi:MAG TPA: SH3 domain-containing protein [Spirochaetota bacterium]|nr:SH3 domain-containing protein [Spirochaetota bacterium]HNT09602.1 SH3 domain-containing protein [Spirochaetota bacterium]